MRNYLHAQQTLINENNALYIERLMLRGKVQRLDALMLENAQLKELLNSTTVVIDEFLVANIIHIDPDPFMQQIILDKGTEHGVYLGQPIIDAHGVMGSIIEVNALTSRVMLLTDASHAVPVESVRNGIRAIAMGTGVSDSLELRHVTNTADIIVGDKFVTSGLDGHYPAGYPVGVVTAIEHDVQQPFASIYVAPNAELTKGRQVLLVKERNGHE